MGGDRVAHEHACIRCPMLRVEPTQRRRLEVIIRNLADRIDEAQANGITAKEPADDRASD